MESEKPLTESADSTTDGVPSKDNGTDFLRESGSTGKKLRLAETVMIILGPVVMGLFIELVGPTLPDLMHRVNCHYEAIATALVARSVGHILTSLIGSIITKRLKDKSAAFLPLAFFLGAAGTMLVPWCTSLLLLTAAFFLQGLANGLIDVLSTVSCSRLWRRRAAVPLHALHFGYGVGGLLAPQLALPFIMRHVAVGAGGDASAGFNDTTAAAAVGGLANWTTSATNGTRDAVVLDWGASRVEIPYVISGSLSAALGVSVACFYLCRNDRGAAEGGRRRGAAGGGRPVAEPGRGRPRCPGCPAGGAGPSQVACLGAMCFLLFNFNGGLHAYAKFLYIFATERVPAMSDGAGAMLNTAFWISFTGGRGLCMLASRWMSPLRLLWAEVAVNACSGSALFFWSDDSRLLLWIGSSVFGFSMGPLIPSLFACANLYVSLEGAAVSLLFVHLAAGVLVYQYLAGHLFERYGPDVHMTVVLGNCLITVAAVSLLSVVLRFKRNRFEKTLAVQFVEEDISVVDASGQDDKQSPGT